MTNPVHYRCVHYGPWPSRGPRCDAPATHQLCQPEGQPNLGGRYCWPHATEIIEEYAVKLGQRWTATSLERGE